MTTTSINDEFVVCGQDSETESISSASGDDIVVMDHRTPPAPEPPLPSTIQYTQKMAVDIDRLAEVGSAVFSTACLFKPERSNTINNHAHESLVQALNSEVPAKLTLPTDAYVTDCKESVHKLKEERRKNLEKARKIEQDTGRLLWAAGFIMIMWLVLKAWLVVLDGRAWAEKEYPLSPRAADAL